MKAKGYIHFDWLIDGHVTIILSHDGDKGSSMQHLTVGEAEVVGRRLIAWAAYQRAREQGRVTRQPGNRCLPKAAATFHKGRRAA